MSYWNAKYKNDYGEYEITFASKQKEETKAVEKLCQAIIDKEVKSADDVIIVRYGRWIHTDLAAHWHGKDECSECTYHEKDRGDLSHLNFCPNCGCKMSKEE